MVLSSFLVASGTVAAQGCGTENDSGFGNADDPSASSGGTSGGGSNGFSSGGGGGDAGPGGTSGGDGGGACEGTLAPAQRLPLKMLIALDQSGSMGSVFNNLNSRWRPVTAALRAFWANPLTEGISANLRLFPPNGTQNSSGSLAASCNAATYATANVEFTALPNAAPFDAVLIDDPGNYSTPTRFVLQGTVAEADAILDADPNAKVVVVLVTDGQPEYCPNNSSTNQISHCQDQVEGRRFPTYVIGVAGQAGLEDNVHDIATAGGGEAFLVSTTNAETTQQEFVAAMNSIRTQLASCEVIIPAPPTGQSLDREKINVTLTTGGQTTALGYNQDCAEPTSGWRFDDVNAPSRIVLCEESCTPLKNDPGAKVDVEFGCTRRPAEVN